MKSTKNDMARIAKLSAQMNSPREWFTVNKAAAVPEVLIYEMIGMDFWGEGLSAKAFRLQINEIAKDNKKMNLRINSPGGSIHDGFAIYSSLIESGMEIDVYVDGLAASSAAFIAMAGTNIFMGPVSEMMIHNPWSMGAGTAADLRKAADHLDSLGAQIAGIFAKKTGIEEKEILEMMESETWMDSAVAVEKGFADSVIEEMKAVACVFDLDEDILPGIPREFVTYQSALKKRALERSMRDAGLSRAEAARRASGSEEKDELIKVAQEKFNNEVKKWLLCQK